ncbi:uncharacterized protein LOC104585096 [Brachypodium distachyon]|uniref:uncharacterized protein LOC104585096 n=1 Tax=Brachypodium distachyon TaxID=15368 RepID=UPI00052FEEE8|nr:uncharacterized protein LOC104585096 [Brachypodium distachyon]|eukprot:XP_010239364.1 uncharacterized protein LOC104585096 [Brachypodium distachyon]
MRQPTVKIYTEAMLLYMGPHTNEYECKSANMVNGQMLIDQANQIDKSELDIKAAKIDVEHQGEGAIHVNDTVIPGCDSKEPDLADIAVLKMGVIDRPRQTMTKFERMKLDRKLRLPDRLKGNLGINHAGYECTFGPGVDEFGDCMEGPDKAVVVNVNSDLCKSHHLEAPCIDKDGARTDHQSTQVHNTRHVSDLYNKENINPNKFIGELNIVRNNQDRGRSESYKQYNN